MVELKRWHLNFDRVIRTETSESYSIYLIDTDAVKENNDGSGERVGNLYVQYGKYGVYADLYLNRERFTDKDVHMLNFFIDRDIINVRENYELCIYDLAGHTCTFQN